MSPTGVLFAMMVEFESLKELHQAILDAHARELEALEARFGHEPADPLSWEVRAAHRHSAMVRPRFAKTWIPSRTTWPPCSTGSREEHRERNA